jgi:hypothetical protein
MEESCGKIAQQAGVEKMRIAPQAKTWNGKGNFGFLWRNPLFSSLFIMRGSVTKIS